MTSFLNANHIRIFDYPRFAEPLRDRVRANAEAVAASVDVTIQYIAKAHIRKEAVVADVIKRRGDHPMDAKDNFSKAAFFHWRMCWSRYCCHLMIVLYSELNDEW